MADSFDVGSQLVAPSAVINGGAGVGYVDLANQNPAPSAPAIGSLRFYADDTGRATFHQAGAQTLTFDSSGLSAPRTLVIPDSDSTIVTVDSVATLTGKTILAADNTVEANVLAGNTVTGNPAVGDYLRFESGSWQPAAISAVAPATYSSGSIGILVGTTAGTVAAGNDGRLSTQQLIDVKKGTPGAGEFSSIAAAVASIVDASAMKRYVIRVGPGVFVEPNITLPQYVYVRGYGKFSTVIMPGAAGITLFNIGANTAIEEVTLSGNGTGQGIICEAGMPTLLSNIIMTNFTKCVTFTSASGPSDVLLHEFVASPPFGMGVHVDGRAISSSHEMKVSVSTGQIRADATASCCYCFEGPHANISANSIRAVDATSGTGFLISDGAIIELGNSKVTGCNNGMIIENIGAGPNIRFRDIMYVDNTTYDIQISHPGTTGIFDGIADRTKTDIDPSATVAVSYKDPVQPANILRGEFIYAPTNDTILTETGSLLIETADIGAYTGGAVVSGAGLSVDVGGGEGYILADAPVNYARKITWANVNVAIPADSTVYVYVNASGAHVAGSVPNLLLNVLLARVVSGSAGIEFIDSQLQNNNHVATRQMIARRDTSGAVYASGSVVTIGAGNTLDITTGVYYYLFNKFTPAGGTGVSFKTYRRDGVGGWITADTTTIGAVYDSGSALTAIPAGKFVQHFIYVVSGGSGAGSEQYLLLYGQDIYDTQSAAESGAIVPPLRFTEGVTRIAGIIGESDGTLTPIDLRPFAGRSFSVAGGSGGGVTAHGDLTGLLNDDHPQYLLTNGIRALTGDLNMDSNNIVSAGLVNGVVVQGHAARHLPNGADPLATAAPILPLTGSTINSVGTANSFARSDHSHAIDLSAVDINSVGGIRSVAGGGTGVSTLTAGSFLVGNGTSTVVTTKVVPAGDVVGTSDGQTLTNKTLVASSTVFSGTGSISFTAGGSANTSIVAGATSAAAITLPTATAVLVGRDTTDTLTGKTIIGGTSGNVVAANRINGVTVSAAAPSAGQFLRAADGTNAAFGAINLATDSLSGVLPVASGGSGQSSLTVDRVVIGNGTSPVNLSKSAPAGAFVGDSDAQVLTNKTLAAASTVVRGATVSDTLTFSVTGTNSITVNGAVATIPSGTHTLVGRATTDTLTNKTLNDASNVVAADRIRHTGGTVITSGSAAPIAGYVLTATSGTAASWQAPGSLFIDTGFAIRDVSDPTITLTFNAAGTTGTGTQIVSVQTSNIVLTLPGITDTIVGRATTDTLTNKTLTNPTISSINNGGTLLLPSGPDSLVSRASSDAFANKLFLDNSCVFLGSGSGSIDFRANGTSGTRTRLIAAQTANADLTLPVVTDTLVGRATTDTLTNKTLRIESTLLNDASSRGFNFSANGTAGAIVTLNNAATASRTLTLPNVTDVLVSRTSTDTLTNKTIVGGSGGNSVAADALRGVSVSAVAPNVGQVLVATGGTGASWQTLAGGGGPIPEYVFLSTSATTTSGAFINATGTDGITVIPYPGSSLLPLHSVVVVAAGPNSAVSGTIRLQDVTNGNTLASLAVPTGTTARTAFTMSSFVSVPTGFALLELQIRRDTGGGNNTFNVYGFYMRFNA